MASYEQFDLLLGEVLECITEAECEIKELSIPFKENALRQIEKSICELWEARDALYQMKPNLRRDFIEDCSDDKQGYEDLSRILYEAAKAEKVGDSLSAAKHFQELLQVSQYGFFRLLAEAGLCRLSSTKK